MAVLNSTKFLLSDAIDLCLPKTKIKMIEIYSDGYLSEPQNAANVESWESEFNMVETQGFHKIDKFPAVKGSTFDQFSDDRTIMILSE